MSVKNPAITFLLSTSLFFLLIFTSIVSALPANTLNINHNIKTIVGQVMPQGWGFFSKSPREADLNAVPLDGQKALQWPNSSLSNYLGISREGRAQGIELGSLIGSINEENYEKCDKDSLNCLESSDSIIQVENKNAEPSICGRWGVINKDPVPWAWGKNRNSIVMPSTIVKVDIKC